MRVAEVILRLAKRRSGELMLDCHCVAMRVGRMALCVSVAMSLICMAAAPGTKDGSRLHVSASEKPHVKIPLVKFSNNPKDRVVVWLTPVQNASATGWHLERHRYRIVERNKAFHPGFLVVPAGSIIEFVNIDPWFHGPFSISGNNRFDLGLGRRGAGKYVRFDHPGISYIFCAIHPGMLAVVLTVDSSYFGISDSNGRVSISNVAPGRYSLHAWRERAGVQTFPTQHVVVMGDQKADLAVCVRSHWRTAAKEMRSVSHRRVPSSVRDCLEAAVTRYLPSEDAAASRQRACPP